MVAFALALLACVTPSAEIGRPGDAECLDLCIETPGLEETVEGDLDHLDGQTWCVCTDAEGAETWISVTLWG